METGSQGRGKSQSSSRQKPSSEQGKVLLAKRQVLPKMCAQRQFVQSCANTVQGVIRHLSELDDWVGPGKHPTLHCSKDGDIVRVILELLLYLVNLGFPTFS
jgi:hypothetical protein